MKYKNTLRQYLFDRQRALNSYIEIFDAQAKEYPEMKEISEDRKRGFTEALEEINKVIAYCEKRGRF